MVPPFGTSHDAFGEWPSGAGLRYRNRGDMFSISSRFRHGHLLKFGESRRKVPSREIPCGRPSHRVMTFSRSWATRSSRGNCATVGGKCPFVLGKRQRQTHRMDHGAAWRNRLPRLSGLALTARNINVREGASFCRSRTRTRSDDRVPVSSSEEWCHETSSVASIRPTIDVGEKRFLTPAPFPEFPGIHRADISEGESRWASRFS
jgi:hypothetical protein